MDTTFLHEILLLIALAAAGAALFARIGLPDIAGFLIAGALVGPGALGLVSDPERVRTLAEFGVVFLLFEIGLELPLERLRRLWRSAFVVGGLQVGLTIVLVFLALRAAGVPSAAALVMGALVAMSSTALVIRLLAERGAIDAPQGQIAVGILLFQDLCIVPFLLAVPILAAGGEDLGTQVALAFARVGAAVAGFALVLRVVLPWVLDRFAGARSSDLFTLVALLLVVGSAVVAEEIGLTLAVGAFVAGLVASASPYASQLFADVVPLRGVLLGLFFTAVGMLLDPAEALRLWPAVLGYVAAVVLLKAGVVVAVVSVVMRQSLRQSLITGLTLAQTGEFSFVLAGAAVAAGLLDAEAQQTFVAGSVLTLIATPFLVWAAPGFGARSQRVGQRARGEASEPPEQAEDGSAPQVVLVGYGLAGRTLGRVLRAREIPFAAVEANARAVQEARELGEPVLYGDATRPSLLDRAGLGSARLVIVAINDPTATELVVRLVRERAPRASILVRSRYVLHVDRLAESGATVVLAEEVESTLGMVSETLRALGTTEGAIHRFVDQLREEGYEALRAPPGVQLDPWLVELLEQVQADWLVVPETFSEPVSLAELDVRSRTGATVLAVERGGRSEANPPADYALVAGDRVLVSGTGDAREQLVRLLEARSTAE